MGAPARDESCLISLLLQILAPVPEKQSQSLVRGTKQTNKKTAPRNQKSHLEAIYELLELLGPSPRKPMGPWLFFFLKKSILCVWVFCLHIYLCTVCVSDSGRGQAIRFRWNGVKRQLWASVWVLGIELQSLEEQPVLLTAKPSLQPLLFCCCFWDRVSLWKSTWPELSM